jgi:hypothetical protein
VTLPGSLVYRDDSTGIWWYNGYGIWHYSIDTCQTWVDVPMLDIRVVEGAGIVDWFDGKQWTHLDPVLEFFDSRYAQSGWHGMNEFAVAYYNWYAYDGEPLKVVEAAILSEQSSNVPWLNHLAPTGGSAESLSPDAKVIGWNFYAYGQWTNKLLASWTIGNPDPLWRPAKNTDPLNVVCEASDIGDAAAHGIFQQNVGTNVISISYDANGYSLHRLSEDLTIVSEYFRKVGSGNHQIENLAIVNHGENVNTFLERGAVFRVGTTTITADNLVSRFETMNDWRGYQADFRTLNSVMVDDSQGGQIQYFGCNVAGPDPYGEALDENIVGPLKSDAQALKIKAIQARQMLGTIANLTKTTVFASSDRSETPAVTAPDPITGVVKYWATTSFDLCLEFGIDPSGETVSFKACHSTPWNLSLWQPRDVTLDAKYGLQSMFDKPTCLDHWPKYTQRAIETLGETEERGYGHLPLYKTS